jgi:hypothetical protein
MTITTKRRHKVQNTPKANLALLMIAQGLPIRFVPHILFIDASIYDDAWLVITRVPAPGGTYEKDDYGRPILVEHILPH